MLLINIFTDEILLRMEIFDEIESLCCSKRKEHSRFHNFKTFLNSLSP